MVEELGDVEIHHPVLPFPGILLCGSHGIVRAAPRSKSVAVLTEHGSKIGVIACNSNCWMNRSSTVGIPSILVPPLGLGISTRLTGLGT